MGHETALEEPVIRRLRQGYSLERWFFTAMAVLMIATSIVGFAPAILNPANRRGPLSALAAIHGIVFFAWLALFLIQVLLAGSGLMVWDRRLGIASIFLLLMMVPLGYSVTVAMVRRGFDLSGDQILCVLAFCLAAVAGDYFVEKRLHPLTLGLAVATVAVLPIAGALIGPSSAWHRFVGRLAGGI